MRQVVHIIRKVDIVKEQIKVLKLEMDYLLLTLHQAVIENNEKERETCTTRLKEIHVEVEALKKQY